MRSLDEIVETGWAEALQPVAAEVRAMGEFLRAELAAGRSYLPAGEHVLRAFSQPFDDVRVLIVGQDPYPTPGHRSACRSRSPRTSGRCRARCRTSTASCAMTWACRSLPTAT